MRRHPRCQVRPRLSPEPALRLSPARRLASLSPPPARRLPALSLHDALLLAPGAGASRISSARLGLPAALLTRPAPRLFPRG